MVEKNDFLEKKLLFIFGSSLSWPFFMRIFFGQIFIVFCVVFSRCFFFAGADGLTKNIDEVASVDDVRRSIEIGRATRIFSVTIQGELLLRGL